MAMKKAGFTTGQVMITYWERASVQTKQNAITGDKAP